MRELFSSSSSLDVKPVFRNRAISSSVEATAAARLSGLTVRFTVKGPARCVAWKLEWMPYVRPSLSRTRTPNLEVNEDWPSAELASVHGRYAASGRFRSDGAARTTSALALSGISTVSWPGE